MKRPGRWPLALIAAPAAVAIWSGWVGLGGLCGFGPVNLAPGIGGGFTLNTAITLPIGVEAYAAYALSVWMWPKAPKDAKRFAAWSALGALAYGMLGQVAYHWLRSRGYTVAPGPVVVLVSCMPVVVLGFAAALTHLLRAEDVAGESPSNNPGRDVPANSPATITETVRVTEGRPPSEWLDDQIMALLSRMSVRSTADALGVSKTRVETAKRRAALAAAPYEIPAREVAPVLAAPAGDVPTSPPVPAGASDHPAGAPVDGTAQLAPAGVSPNGHRP